MDTLEFILGIVDSITGFISNGIVGTITGVIALIVSVHYNRKAIKHAEKDQNRNKILEEVQGILTPTIDDLTKEIEVIQNKKISWHRYTSGVCGFNYSLIRFFYDEQYGSIRYAFGKKNSGALRDVLTKFPKLKGMFSSHDFLIDELNKLYVDIEKEIKTSEIKEQLTKMVKEFNKGKSASYRIMIENPVLVFSEHILRLLPLLT